MNDERTTSSSDPERPRLPSERLSVPAPVRRSSAREVTGFAARQTRFMAFVMVLVTGLTAVFVYVTPLTFEAIGVVLIERGKNPTLRSDPLPYEDQVTDVINSEIGIVKSRTVAEGVIDRLGLLEKPAKASGSFSRRIRSTLDDLGLTPRLSRKESLLGLLDRKLKAEQPPLSSLLRVSFTAEDPAFAAGVAQAAIDVYMERHREIFEDNTAEFFAARVQEAEEQLHEIREAIRRSTSTPAIEGLTLQRDAVEKTYMFYRERLDRARADVAADKSLVNVRLVDYPAVPEKPTSSRLRRILLGLAAGIVLAAGLAFLRDYFDHTIHSPDEIAARLDVPVLGSVRETRKKKLR